MKARFVSINQNIMEIGNYDFLPTDLCKRLFLMCSIFPNHYNIPMETLTRYCMGLALIPNIESVKKARDNFHQTVEELKAACLLLDGDKKETFDIVIFIVEFPHPLMVQRSRLPSIVTTKAKVVGVGAILRPISSVIKINSTSSILDQLFFSGGKGY
ncbi:hypothetical protein KY290_017135 [Solanum tuberosum]|uniref:Uncharacterized protein n=1 Tax=Solanum tuberosum TaxID=4113 RepID=A0ABQ7VCQ1_SOLTU|nr:hypothetical protein KY290_017135 [Solanum tuberosum]